MLARALVFLLALLLLPVTAAADLTPLDRAVDALKKNVERLQQKMGVPGLALAVVQGDEVVFYECLGVRRLGAPGDVDARTVFQIASITKSFTATLAAMEMAAGHFASTDKVRDRRPGFRLYDPWVTQEFTVEDLMAQRSGLVSCAGDLQLLFGKQRSEMAEGLQYIPPVTSFRSRFAYQNVPFIEVAYIVEKYSGWTWEENVAKRLFGPLEMNDSSTDLASFVDNPNHAALHQRQNGAVAALDDDWPWMDVAYTVGPAGGINASLADMTRYLTMHMNHGVYGKVQVADAKALDDLHNPRTPLPNGILGRTAFYCQGFIWEECGGYTLVWHNGSSSGHQNIMAFDPDAKLGLVVLSNLTNTQLPEALAMILFRVYHNQATPEALVQEILKHGQAAGQAAPAKAAPAALPANAEDYVGEYENPVHGSLYISNLPEGLLVKLGKGPGQFVLSSRGGDNFWLTLPYVDSDASGPAVFHRDQSGRVVSVELEKFVENGAGVFTRD